MPQRFTLEPPKGFLGSDWLSRVTIPDLYPRKADPYRPRGVPGQPGGEIVDVGAQLTTPGARPFVYQRALTYTITAGVASVPLMNQDTPCEVIILDVYSTAANSVFVGYGSGVTTLSGLEIRAGLPVSLAVENNREQWELQRSLEVLATIIAIQAGMSGLGPYRAPRVVFNARDWYLVATAPTAVSVTLFHVPELQ